MRQRETESFCAKYKNMWAFQRMRMPEKVRFPKIQFSVRKRSAWIGAKGHQLLVSTFVKIRATPEVTHRPSEINQNRFKFRECEPHWNIRRAPGPKACERGVNQALVPRTWVFVFSNIALAELLLPEIYGKNWTKQDITGTQSAAQRSTVHIRTETSQDSPAEQNTQQTQTKRKDQHMTDRNTTRQRIAKQTNTETEQYKTK